MLRIAFVGVGGIAKRHLATIEGCDEAQVVAVCDVDLERARAVADEHGAKAFADAVSMYESAEPDAALICVPPFAHGEIEIEAARRGVDLFIEKPVALTMETAASVLRAIREAGVIAQVGYMYRLCRTVRRLREMLEGRAIALVDAHYIAGGMPAKSWWPRMDGSGGQLIEQATHMIDLGRVLAGEVASVSAATATVRDWRPPEGWAGPESWQTHFAEGFEIPDSSVVLLRYETGALGTLSCSMVPQGSWTNGMTVAAEGLSASIGGPVPDLAWESLRSRGAARPERGWSSQVLLEFIGATLVRCEASVPYEEGMRSLAVSLAACRSAEGGGAPVAPAEMIQED